jgi:hypothetical protein
MELRKAGKVLLMLLLVGIAGMVLLAGYAIHAEHRAADKAQEFCARIKTGSSTDGMAEAAIAAGADAGQTRWIRPIAGPSWLAVTFTGIAPLSRHICSVTVENGKVVTALYSYMD